MRTLLAVQVFRGLGKLILKYFLEFQDLCNKGGQTYIRYSTTLAVVPVVKPGYLFYLKKKIQFELKIEYN